MLNSFSLALIKEKDHQTEIISYILKGIENSEHLKALASHRRKKATCQKVSERFFGIQYQMMLMSLLENVTSAKNKKVQFS